MGVLISKALIDSNISHDKLVLISNVVKEYDETKEKIKHSNNTKWYFIVLSVWCLQK